MTIPSAVNKSGPYFYNGATTSFAYGFKISDETHIRVVETVVATGVETDLVLSTDYTVTGVNSDTGTVVISPARASGGSVTLVRAVPFTQEIVLENQGAYFAKVVEKAFDNAVARDQQLQEQISRAVVVPVSADATDLETLIGGVVALLDSVDDVVTVADNIGAVVAVAADEADIGTVAGIAGAVSTVAGISAAVSTVAGISANVTAVAADAADIGTVAGSIANVTTVAGIAANVTTVAGMASDIGTVVANITAIQDAPDEAAAAAQSAIEAAASAASVTPADLVHYTAETNSEARQAQARKNIGMEFGYPLLHVVDEKAQNTQGGASSSGINTRALNTVRTNEIAGASLVSNQVILPPGTYWLEASAPSYQGNLLGLFIRNVTAGTNILVGQSDFVASATPVQMHSRTCGRLTVAVTTTIDLRHAIEVGVATNGLGLAKNVAGLVEVYAEVKIWKLK